MHADENLCILSGLRVPDSLVEEKNKTKNKERKVEEEKRKRERKNQRPPKSAANSFGYFLNRGGLCSQPRIQLTSLFINICLEFTCQKILYWRSNNFYSLIIEARAQDELLKISLSLSLLDFKSPSLNKINGKKLILPLSCNGKDCFSYCTGDYLISRCLT